MDPRRPNPIGRPPIALVVDDAQQRSQLTAFLTSFYTFTQHKTAQIALSVCRTQPPMLILVSEQLSTGNGFDFVRTLRLDPQLASIPVIVLLAKNTKVGHDQVAQCGANGCLVAPISRSGLIKTIAGWMNQAVERRWLALPSLHRRTLTDTLNVFNGIADVISEGNPLPYQFVSEVCTPLVEVIANDDFRNLLDSVKDHDNYSYSHSLRVATYLTFFGLRLGLSKEEQLILAGGGLLHDVGKMSIPYEVLNKPGRLTDAERAIMRTHVTGSIDYLKRCDDLPNGIMTIAAQHHERLDGSGYPLGLSGNKLDQLARMASIVDVFSALLDRRAYKAPCEPEAALRIMSNEMTSQLDMKLLKLFRGVLLDAALGQTGAETVEIA